MHLFEGSTKAHGTIRPSSLDILGDLIAFDTTSRNSNLAIIEYIADYLSDHGIASRLTYNSIGDKANLHAFAGPSVAGGIALSGHTDVVPVDNQDWRTDPWRLTETDSLLYGRGACDMKGFIAVVLSFVPDFKAASLRRPVHFCFSYDEELGCLGVPDLLEELTRHEARPAMCIVGEPTEMKVAVSHKGIIDTTVDVRGRELHSSLAPRGVNAVVAASRMITFLDDEGRRKANDGPFEEGFDIGHTTVHTGIVSGGSNLNTVPGNCRFEFEVRNLPVENPDAILTAARTFAAEVLEPEMRAIDPACGFTWKEQIRVPGFHVDPSDEVVGVAKALSGSNSTVKIGFCTEASLFQQSGIPTAICGPGSIRQAHGPDEYVSVSQLSECEKFMARLVDRLST